MKQTVTDQFAMDEFVSDDVQAPRVYDLPPTSHFLETDADRERHALHAKVVPLLTTSLQRRVAAMMILDRVPVTIPEFRDFGVDRKTLTATKREVFAAIQAVTAPQTPSSAMIGAQRGVTIHQSHSMREVPVAVQNMKKTSRRTVALRGLLTGRTFTFAEFRDELAEKDERIARSLLRWLVTRGANKLGATFDAQRSEKNAITSIRLVNVDELVAQLNPAASKTTTPS